MSSTEPPSRNAPRNQPQDTKAARDELSSKGKVEKVREIDADEQTRKRKFLKFYKDDQIEDDNFEEQSRPKPFDLLSGKSQTPGNTTTGQGPFGSSRSSSYSDEEENSIPGPGYSPPPDVNAAPASREDEAETAATEGALPQSDDFWVEFDFPDQPTPPTNFQEMPGLASKASFAPPPQQGKGPNQLPGTTPTPLPGRQSAKGSSSQESKVKGEKEKGTVVSGQIAKEPTLQPVKKEVKRAQNSPFGPPGKPIATEKVEPQTPKQPVHAQTGKPKEPEAKKLPSPFEPPPKTTSPSQLPSSMKPKRPFAQPHETHESSTPKVRPVEKGEEAYLGPIAEPTKFEKKETKEKSKEEGFLTQEPGLIPMRTEDREGGGKDNRDKEKKIVEIESPSLPALPSNVQPMAMNAVSQAAPYINPNTNALFFQMVGTMYVMSGPQGVSRTEIVLNNPAFATSKFYGSTITIEKYATAPDSFNIRLTGSQEAVVAFKENIPSLMTAFQNGKFAFKVNRLDVEYTIEKPVFRRKEKGEDKGEAGGGDLGERRK